MKKLLLLFGVALFAYGCATSGPMEVGIDRRGMDYRQFELISASPSLCSSACMADPRCKAWTYVNPGVQGPKPRCWLKNSVPQPITNSCCVSGVKL